MTINEYMKKNNVSKKKYVESWLEDDLIPGVTKDKKSGELFFPKSARRPYRPRLKATSDASVIRASILNACLKREHVSYKTYHMSNGEFLSFINDLIIAGLIKERIEDGITYYDSTIKSDKYRHESFKNLKKFVIDCMSEVAESIAYGTTKAMCENIMIA